MWPSFYEQLANQLASLLHCATMGHPSSLSVRMCFFLPYSSGMLFATFFPIVTLPSAHFRTLPKNWRQEILAFFQFLPILVSNGFVEGKNNRTKAMIRQAYGYHNRYNLRMRILLGADT